MNPPPVMNAIADELLARGACAVWLAGSYARGDAGRYSDIDLGAIYEERPAEKGPRLQRRDGHLVSVAWVTAEQTRASFRDPAQLGAAVPGWRRAVLVRDPGGMGAALQEEAIHWDWDRDLEAACDAWVGAEVEFYAEYAQKIGGCLDRHNPLAAAAHRSLLATRLPLVLSVHRRLLYGGENALLACLADAVGEPWASTQAAALGLGGEDLEASCAAALRLYALAAAEAGPLLDERQRAIIEPAAAGDASTSSGSSSDSPTCGARDHG